MPILISDHDYFLVGEDRYDTSFVFRIYGPDLDPTILRQNLQEIYDTPIDDLNHRATAAKKYFDEIIRVYFQDPTAYFIKWLENEY